MKEARHVLTVAGVWYYGYCYCCRCSQLFLTVWFLMPRVIDRREKFMSFGLLCVRSCGHYTTREVIDDWEDGQALPTWYLVEE
jgi:hypothetical protein